MSTILILSAAAIALLLTSSLLFSQALQPVQAQTPITFRTPTPAVAQPYPTTTLTLDAQGTLSSDSTEAMITKGTFQVTDTGSGQTLYNGSIKSGGFTNSTDGGNINAFGDLDYPAGGGTFGISTSCSASTNNDIQLGLPDYSNNVFQGVVECSVGEVNAIAQPSSSSSSMTGIKQDSDRDGVPDSSDKCAHNSNPKCFKEGDTSNTTTTTAHEQEQSSSLSSPSSTTGTTTTTNTQDSNNNNSRDSDGDRVPDSSDKCAHNSNPKCFKEGDTSNTTTTSSTTQQQQQPSSSNRTGNQTG